MIKNQRDKKESRYEKQLRGIKLLYVEDEGIIRMDVAQYLQKKVNVLEAADGQEGFELFCMHRPDIVVTDIRMPVMDGLEMARKIKEIDDEVPIIITTAYSDERFLMESINIGIDKYVKKPIDFKDLTNAIIKAAKSIAIR
jgi:YesN/AraC family two-component response regulator